MLKFVCALLVCFMACGGVGAADLQGTTFVNMTSDTAANAKNMAVDEAQRQIILDVLRPYTDSDALKELVAQSKTSDLTNLISSSSIGGEKSSDTVYSAKFSMVIDADAARKWLDTNNVQNWLPNMQSQDTFVVRVVLNNKLADWIDLNRIANSEKIDLNLMTMSGNVLQLNLPQAVRGAFTITLRENGWRYSDQDGVLQISR